MADVVVGIINIEDQILMIRRSKKEGNLEWCFPGGKVEENETKEEACIREVYEETGVNVIIKKKLGERIHPDTKIKITYFLCHYIVGEFKISNPNEIRQISLKTKVEIENIVGTDIFYPVKDYIKKYIK